VLEHADAPGFSVPELERLAAMVLVSKGKLKKAERLLSDAGFVEALLCLRLALVFCHARSKPTATEQTWSLTAPANLGFWLQLDAAWAKAHPQSVFLLQQECAAWEKVGVSLHVEYV
jgi:exopolyphosphatase/guanosine-5'-triphosphate,3'-diphosphate pyrophosphatase